MKFHRHLNSACTCLSRHLVRQIKVKASYQSGLTCAGNRFDALAPGPLDSPHWKERHIPSRYRRSRNSRGTKEAKRRRDARRSRRKLAAPFMDKQLLHDIDATLNSDNVFPSVQSHGRISTTMPSAPRLPPPPSHLPAIDFPNFSINDFPQLKPLSETLSPPSSPPTVSIPSWCPFMPLLTRNGTWSEGLPKFYDLSSLPSPKHEIDGASFVCRDMQLWSGKLDLKPRQSRFFPSSIGTPAKPQIKLPTRAYESSSSDIGQSKSGCDSAVLNETCEHTITTNLTIDIAETVKDSTKPTSTANISADKSSAAGLWRILATQDSLNHSEQQDPYLAVLQCDAEQDSYLSCWQAAIEADDRGQLPAELDGREIPYVHANSLIGWDNDLAKLPYIDGYPAVNPSNIDDEPFPSMLVGLNELLVDQDILPPNEERSSGLLEGQAQTHDPNTISCHCSYVLADILPVDCFDQEDGGKSTLANSDAHFQSEKGLFEPPPLVKEASKQSIVDLAEFLKMGHAKNCWCRDCDEAPELVAEDKLTETDEDWMFYWTSEEASSSTKAASDSGEEEEKQAARVKCSNAPEWDHFFPCKPESAWEAGLIRHGDEGIGLGAGFESD